MGLIVRNPLHATVLDNSSTFIIWLCRLIVVGSSIGLSYGVFYLWDEELTNQLNNPFVPIIVIAVGAYIVSQPFFLVHRYEVFIPLKIRPVLMEHVNKSCHYFH